MHVRARACAKAVAWWASGVGMSKYSTVLTCAGTAIGERVGARTGWGCACARSRARRARVGGGWQVSVNERVAANRLTQVRE